MVHSGLFVLITDLQNDNRKSLMRNPEWYQNPCYIDLCAISLSRSCINSYVTPLRTPSTATDSLPTFNLALQYSVSTTIPPISRYQHGSVGIWCAPSHVPNASSLTRATQADSSLHQRAIGRQKDNSLLTI